MVFEVVLSFQTEKDLAEVFAHIAKDQPIPAWQFVEALEAKIQSLSTMPKRCPLAGENLETSREVRCLLHGRYRILFTVDEKRVSVLRAVHGARQIDDPL